MSPHVDILDQPESLRKPLLRSLALHGAVFAVLAISISLPQHKVEPWGDLNGGGPGSVAISMVNRIPLPSRAGIVNPVANDTESSVPAPPPKPKEARKALPPEPDAIPLKGRAAKRAATESASTNKWRAQQQDRPNQLYSTTGPALVSPMIGQTGSGGVGVGQGGPFGNRFGWYVDLLKRRVAEKWRTGDIDARIRSAPPVVVTFMIQRDGTVPPNSVRIVQRSGNPALDYSAQRAVLEASPLPQLPPGYEKNDATVEFWFELKR